jgi:radical SAM superfamily enzyme YgiQ (UPF0313 family)
LLSGTAISWTTSGSTKEIIQKISDAKPKAVGVSLNGFNRKVAERFIAALREAAPGILIVVGGYDCVYPNVGPQLFKDYDYMIIGEAEDSLPHLLRAIQNNERPGLEGYFLCSMHPATSMSRANCLQILDVDSPRHEWVDRVLYQTFDRKHLVPITASRGCNWAMSFLCGMLYIQKRFPSMLWMRSNIGQPLIQPISRVRCEW